MRETVILALLCIGVAATSDLSGYRPRGWRPDGPRFNPDNNRLHAHYGSPVSQDYGTATTERDPFVTARPWTTTTVKTTGRTTTTPRSTEPTTASNGPAEDDDFATNPALAIANSFAFNRPIYIYSGLPFLPAQIIAQ